MNRGYGVVAADVVSCNGGNSIAIRQSTPIRYLGIHEFGKFFGLQLYELIMGWFDGTSIGCYVSIEYGSGATYRL